MCVSKKEVIPVAAHGNGMISLSTKPIEEKCGFCATPLDVLYDWTDLNCKEGPLCYEVVN